MRGCAFLFFEYGSHLFCGIGCLKSKIRKAGLKLMVSCIGFELFVYCTFELKCSSEKICHLRHMLMLLFGIVALPFPCLIFLTSLPTAISCYQLSPTQKFHCIKLTKLYMLRAFVWIVFGPQYSRLNVKPSRQRCDSMW